MKKILLSFGAALLLAVGAQAQTGFGIRAGVNLPKMHFSGDGMDGSYTTGASTNFFVSGYASILAAPNFAIQPGVSLQGKGGKESFDDEGSSTTNLMSIEIPVNAVYYIPTGDAGSVFLGAGPYAGFNISGQDKYKVDGATESEDIKFGSDMDQMKRFDYGLNFTGGYKLSNGLTINAGYGLGLGNLSNFDGGSAKNRVLSFGVGFEF